MRGRRSDLGKGVAILPLSHRELLARCGRDHNHYGFTGRPAGYAADEFGFAAVENKVHIDDLHATMLHLLGFDHEKLTYRDGRLTDVHGRVVKETPA